MNWSDAMIFKTAFYYMFLEISIESQYFSIIFEPWWLYSWNKVILWSFSLFLKAKVVDTFSHLID